MKTTITLLAALLLASLAVSQAAEVPQPAVTNYPEFSWETVPVYKMFGSPQLLTEEQAQIIAKTSDFICIEKAHGREALGGAELGAKYEISRFKQLNPRTYALFYFNAAIAYPFTTYSQGLRKGSLEDEFKPFIAKDVKTGELILDESRFYRFDVLNPEFRKWWTETVAKGVNETGAAGVFVDQMHGNAWLHPGKQVEVAAAQAEMMRMTKQAIGATKILLLNNGAHIPALFEIGDAFMFEHYSPNLLTEEAIVKDWALLKRISGAGKIAVWRIGIEVEDKPAGKGADRPHLSDAEYQARAERELPFYLAAFLIGAQEHSYFQYGWGWNLDNGSLVDYPELHKPLGQPKGDARQEAKWIFYRKFEHANVRVDLDKREGTIEWTSKVRSYSGKKETTSSLDNGK